MYKKNLKVMKAFKGNYYTTIITQDDSEKQVKSLYSKLLREEGIYPIKEWITITGKEINEQFSIPLEWKYTEELVFLAFPQENLDIYQRYLLEDFRIGMGDKWFADMVDHRLNCYVCGLPPQEREEVVKYFSIEYQKHHFPTETKPLNIRIKNHNLRKAYQNNFYTIIGCDKDINQQKNDYSKLLKERGIGKVKEWITYTGEDMNKEFNLKNYTQFRDDVIFLSFPIDNFDLAAIDKLADLKEEMMDQWFRDVVDNILRETKELSKCNVL